MLGCIFVDHQGLCLGGIKPQHNFFFNWYTFVFSAKGQASTDSAGIITALADQSAKLDPSGKPPVIHFENDSHSCTINKLGVTVAIFKSNQS